MSKDHFSLLGLNGFGLLLEVAVLLLDELLLSVELLLHVFDLLVSFVLDGLQVLGESVPLLEEPLELLLQSTVLSDHALGAELQSFVQLFLLLFELIDGVLVLLVLGLHVLLDFMQLLFVFLLELVEDGVVVVLVLHLGVLAVALQLVDRLLEQGLLIFVILLVLLLLLLKELEFASP